MMVHGAGRREPWTFSRQTLDVYRRYARLHTDLFPYTYAYAHQASRTGIPIMRAMPLEFPDDPAAWGELAEHQYCFGAELLVAPVYYGFSRTRLVYLPQGRWLDFWTGELQEGGRVVRCQAELEQIPVFARAGAIIPQLDPSPDTLLPAAKEGVRSAGDDLRIDVYPGADGHFRLADGTEFAWDETAQTLAISGSPVERQLSARRVGIERGYERVMVAGPGVAMEWPF
jgi:alpha-glucosidase (family GH31 glycosyl hydrolase)